jgi:hypothetical protein
MLDDVGGGAEGHRSSDHLIAPAYPEHLEREVQTRGAGVQPQRRRRLYPLRECGFEPPRLGSRGDPARPEGVDHLVDFLLPDRRGREEQELPACLVLARFGLGRGSAGERRIHRIEYE